ncbi:MULTISPECIES: ABC transporter ATP-binding protein [Clostridium]|uniref:ABC transporter ATP-binding protein n=1 Tax=Clostridium TaxID=1485 RepID=UPI0018AA0CE5|nr:MULTISPECIES: ATP-binding cassette domain-containing protein [Clostridium]MDB2156463.1 ATP-binding cassette domain-containing protein [Clostridium butyricum]MDU3580674.1 ATP-binding cassette domain-containing protein [Clostridium butyricum]MDU3593777.1 ATP-binding cassette domain-containing protein [Clostridium butyricum]UZT07387.1 ATP-binding cassette domain-containing protein [Clostridium sp. LQ25]
MLKVTQLCKVFNQNTINENRVFDELSLNVCEGDFISIIGSNGAGKSTLLNMISGTLQADSGSILLDGDEVINKPEYVRCKSIGRVFQDPSKGVAPNMTILENIALADNKGKNFGFGIGVNKKRIDYYKEMVSEINLGLEDKLHNKVQLLSGGQRQALTLLMSVMSKPKLLLLDEHTAALDPKTSEKIMEITRKIVKESGITTLMVTHNLKHAIENGNRLFMMHRGEILVDIKGREKERLDTNSLLELFEKANGNGEEGLSDRTLFG